MNCCRGNIFPIWVLNTFIAFDMNSTIFIALFDFLLSNSCNLSCERLFSFIARWMTTRHYSPLKIWFQNILIAQRLYDIIIATWLSCEQTLQAICCKRITNTGKQWALPFRAMGQWMPATKLKCIEHEDYGFVWTSAARQCGERNSSIYDNTTPLTLSNVIMLFVCTSIFSLVTEKYCHSGWEKFVRLTNYPFG